MARGEEGEEGKNIINHVHTLYIEAGKERRIPQLPKGKLATRRTNLDKCTFLSGALKRDYYFPLPLPWATSLLYTCSHALTPG